MAKEERIEGGFAMGIIAIVCAEVLSRINYAGFLQDGHLSSVLKIILYATSASGYPALFFLSGTSTFARLQRSRAGLLKSVALGTLYPYLLWSILQMALQWLLADYQNDVGQQFELVRLASAPVGQLWFFYAVFICQIVACMTVWPRPAKNRYLLTLADRCLLAAIILVGAVIAIQSSWGIVTMTCRGLVFFMCGVLFASRSNGQSQRAFGPVAGLMGSVVFAAAATIGQRAGHYRDFYSLLASLLGIAAAVQIGGLFATWRSTRWIAFIGSSWRAVYLLHVLVTALVWNALLALGMGQPAIHFVLGSALGLSVPAAIHLLARRLGIAGWAGFDEPAASQYQGENFADAAAQRPAGGAGSSA